MCPCNNQQSTSSCRTSSPGQDPSVSAELAHSSACPRCRSSLVAWPFRFISIHTHHCSPTGCTSSPPGLMRIRTGHVLNTATRINYMLFVPNYIKPSCPSPSRGECDNYYTYLVPTNTPPRHVLYSLLRNGTDGRHPALTLEAVTAFVARAHHPSRACVKVSTHDATTAAITVHRSLINRLESFRCGPRFIFYAIRCPWYARIY